MPRHEDSRRAAQRSVRPLMSLPRRQQLCFDAIEQSFLMTEIAYRRLVYQCARTAHEVSDMEGATLLLDAWSIVDVVKRLRTLLQHAPGVTQGTHLKSFLEQSAVTVAFRDHAQHMEERMAQTAETGHPIWGSQSWLRVEPGSSLVASQLYIPGRLAKVKGIPVVNPAGKTLRAEIDHFQMAVGTQRLDLSALALTVSAFAARWHAAMATAGTRQVRDGHSLVMLNMDT